MRALFRLPRAAAVSGSTVLLAAAAHTAAGGSLPDPLIGAGLLALVLLPSVWLCGRKVSQAAMVAVLGVGQLTLHEAFNVLSQSSATVPTLGPTAGHVHVLAPLAAHAAGAAGHSEGTGMLLAHALATLATAILLARAEAALWALGDWLRPLVRMLALPALHPAPSVPAFTQVILARSRGVARLPTLRGPPPSCAA
ncbi:hypothetical protein GCM10012320_33200 [Sinomonas cellulolyticus]|uniref:MFS transporter n=1 Tax=Sinomonas cellulolyticus TaxID=2801916 RepID=A0ABS1JXC9_9MICC|nr:MULTISPECIES: hypothetical protein [Sinomonas]MBL0704011.1 hypothetical protein [Sinomonas cellulolyticus]GHG59193.1 hypothetical protein GCM10012320_33200 [Sinomonas sp. KCTC 49339]